MEYGGDVFVSKTQQKLLKKENFKQEDVHLYNCTSFVLGDVHVCMFSGFFIPYVLHFQRTPNTYQTRNKLLRNVTRGIYFPQIFLKITFYYYFLIFLLCFCINTVVCIYQHKNYIIF